MYVSQAQVIIFLFAVARSYNPIAIPTPRVGERRYTIHEASPAGVYNWPQHVLTYQNT